MLDFTAITKLTQEGLVDELAIRIYEPPLAPLRERIDVLPAALQILFLIIDFDTEVAMQGMLGFLENSTGKYLPQTIEALGRIGAQRSADVLKRIQKIME